MKRPVNTNSVPRGGWTVNIEGAGPAIQSWNFSEFIAEVLKRLKTNNLERHGWREWVLDLMCQQRPDIEAVDDDAPKTRAMTGEDVKRFMTAMWTAREEGFAPVDEETQNQRVETCLACPKLGFISCFVGCGSLSEALAQFVMGRTIRRHEEIHKKSCLACGCTAEVKTMWPVDLIRKIDAKHELQPDYHESCWILNEPQNPPNIPPIPDDSSPQPPPTGE